MRLRSENIRVELRVLRDAAKGGSFGLQGSHVRSLVVEAAAEPLAGTFATSAATKSAACAQISSQIPRCCSSRTDGRALLGTGRADGSTGATANTEQKFHPQQDPLPFATRQTVSDWSLVP